MPGYHSPKEKRRARHIEESERKRGRSEEEAKRIAWATVNARKSFDPRVHVPTFLHAAVEKHGKATHPSVKEAAHIHVDTFRDSSPVHHRVLAKQHAIFADASHGPTREAHLALDAAHRAEAWRKESNQAGRVSAAEHGQPLFTGNAPKKTFFGRKKMGKAFTGEVEEVEILTLDEAALEKGLKEQGMPIREGVPAYHHTGEISDHDVEQHKKKTAHYSLLDHAMAGAHYKREAEHHARLARKNEASAHVHRPYGQHEGYEANAKAHHNISVGFKKMATHHLSRVNTAGGEGAIRAEHEAKKSFLEKAHDGDLVSMGAELSKQSYRAHRSSKPKTHEGLRLAAHRYAAAQVGYYAARKPHEHDYKAQHHEDFAKQWSERAGRKSGHLKLEAETMAHAHRLHATVHRMAMHKAEEVEKAGPGSHGGAIDHYTADGRPVYLSQERRRDSRRRKKQVKRLEKEAERAEKQHEKDRKKHGKKKEAEKSLYVVDDEVLEKAVETMPSIPHHPSVQKIVDDRKKAPGGDLHLHRTTQQVHSTHQNLQHHVDAATHDYMQGTAHHESQLHEAARQHVVARAAHHHATTGENTYPHHGEGKYHRSQHDAAMARAARAVQHEKMDEVHGHVRTALYHRALQVAHDQAGRARTKAKKTGGMAKAIYEAGEIDLLKASYFSRFHGDKHTYPNAQGATVSHHAESHGVYEHISGLNTSGKRGFAIKYWGRDRPDPGRLHIIYSGPSKKDALVEKEKHHAARSVGKAEVLPKSFFKSLEEMTDLEKADPKNLSYLRVHQAALNHHIAVEKHGDESPQANKTFLRVHKAAKRHVESLSASPETHRFASYHYAEQAEKHEGTPHSSMAYHALAHAHSRESLKRTTVTKPGKGQASPSDAEVGQHPLLGSQWHKKSYTDEAEYLYIKENEEMSTDKNSKYDDLFKSELGEDLDRVLIQCPHCDEDITKSQVLEKGRRGKGHNKKGVGSMPPSASTKTVPSSRPGKGIAASPSTPPKMRKADDCSDDSSSKDEDKLSKADDGEAEAKVAKSVEQPQVKVYGSKYFQLVDDGNDQRLADRIEKDELRRSSLMTMPMDRGTSKTRILG